MNLSRLVKLLSNISGRLHAERRCPSSKTDESFMKADPVVRVAGLQCLIAGVACLLVESAYGAPPNAPSNASAGEAAPVAFQFDQPTTILSTQDMDRYGLFFPDGTLWFVRHDGPDPYYVFGSGSSSNGVGRAAHLPPATYVFAGTLESLHPVNQRNGLPVGSLMSGEQQPSPDGADFDRDYAGGGPTYSLMASDRRTLFDEVCGRAASAGGSAARSGVLLQIYHGEYHSHPQPRVKGPGYGGSGMAISCDGGSTFLKIGQILAPHVGRNEFLSTHDTGGLWADGTMVEGYAHGEHDCASSACEKYYYLVFTDHNSSDEPYSGLSIARVRADDLLNAVRQRRAPVFRKYYNPSGELTFAGDYFTEPGIGGRSTPVVFTPGQHINTPGVVYDEYLRRFVLFYQSNQKQVELRTSPNLISWSAPTVAFRLDAASDRKVFYPSVAGDGPDPQLLGRMFYLYFLVREHVDGRFSNPELLREKVSVAP